MFKEISGGSAIDIKKEKDKPYQGVYRGFKTITTKIGDQFVYKFEDSASKTMFEVYGFTNLNRAMENIIKGAMVRMTYTGTKNCETKFGMKDVHQVVVEVDDDYIKTAEDYINVDNDTDPDPF